MTSLLTCLCLSLLLNALLLVLLDFAFQSYKRARADYDAAIDSLNEKNKKKV